MCLLESALLNTSAHLVSMVAKSSLGLTNFRKMFQLFITMQYLVICPYIVSGYWEKTLVEGLPS